MALTDFTAFLYLLKGLQYVCFLHCYASSDFLHLAYCVFLIACYAITVLMLGSYYVDNYDK